MIDIHCCDNLELLQKLPNNHIDLIYCDVLYGTGRNFGDYQDLKPIRSEIENHYIPRIKEMHRVLKETGSIYLQMDTRINHWMRCILDDVFGYENFRNEVVWHYRTGNISKRQFQRKHDVIFLYSKGMDMKYNPLELKEYYVQIYGPGFKPSFKGRKHGEDNKGKYRMSLVDDVWDISAVFTLSKENVHYPTQKPKALLERIIRASSNEKDLVADFYMGSGTTAVVCKELNRNFIGCDISEKAIRVTRERLEVAQERINKELAEIDSRLF